MLQLVDTLFLVQTPPVLSDTLSLKVDGNRLGSGFDRYLSSAVHSRDRVIIRVKTDCTKPVHPTGGTFTWVKGITGQRVQLLTLPVNVNEYLSQVLANI